ncbi:hypothetical protein, partial [Vibrio harveyi]|uniref:hypothetical protein n=1 Tax=Vibrio harveyi TaxID=669 RepID=UPI001E543225
IIPLIRAWLTNNEFSSIYWGEMIKKTLLFDKIKLPFCNNCEANRSRRHKSGKIIKNRCDL